MKVNLLLITGGTGGHVIPAKNFANYLSLKDINQIFFNGFKVSFFDSFLETKSQLINCFPVLFLGCLSDKSL